MTDSAPILWIILSAGFSGLVHSLAPAHWLPVVLLGRSRKWGLRAFLVGAFVAGAGHVLISLSVALAAIYIEGAFWEGLESLSGWILLVLGLVFAGVGYWRHARCSGHTHHGPTYRGDSGPLAFLFLSGFSPCLVVIPSFLAAGPQGRFVVFLTAIAFSIGVWLAVLGATTLVSRGVMKLDWPWLEHYGDVIVGVGVALMGALMLMGVGYGHSH